VNSGSRKDRAQSALDLLRQGHDEAAAPEETPSRGRAPAVGESSGRDIVAGALVALIAVPMCLSAAALIYSGDLAPMVPVGVAGAFIGAAVVAATVSRFGSIPFSIGTVALEIGIVLSYIASEVASTLDRPEALFPTVWVSVILGTLFTGVSLLLIGRLGIGRWIRFMPYPVIAGFLAGMGWLAFTGAFRVMAGVSLSFSGIPELMTGEKLLLWGPGFLFAVSLIAVRSQTDHFLVMPVLVTGWFVLFNAACGIATLFDYQPPDRFFFSSVSPAGFIDFLRDFDIRQVDANSLLEHAPLFAAMSLLAASSILLNCSALEVAWGTDCDPDRELRVSGLASIVSGLLGGMAGHLSLGMSMLSFEAHGRSRRAGYTMAIFVLAVLLIGTPLIAFYPKPVIGGLLLSFGLAMIAEYLIGAARRVPRGEWLVILTITLVVAWFGLLEGIVVGLVLACIQFAWTSSRQPVIRRESTAETEHSHVERTLTQRYLLEEHGARVSILELQGYLFFGVAAALLDWLRQRSQHTEQQPLQRFVIFDFRFVSGFDSSAINSFTRMRQIAESHGITLLFAGLSPGMAAQLEAAGCHPDDDTLRIETSRDAALEWCEDRILSDTVVRRPRVVPLGVLLGDLGLDVDTTRDLTRHMERLVLEAGECLLRPGCAREALFLIESGRVYEEEFTGEAANADVAESLTEPGAHRGHRLRSLTSGATLNVATLFKDIPARTTVTAAERSVVHRLTRENFKAFRHECPDRVSAVLELFLELVLQTHA